MRKKHLIVFSVLMAVLLNACAGQSQNAARDYDISVLTITQQSIIPIAAFAASGDQEKLKKALNEGLDNGLTVNEIKEVLVQAYAYAGFPRSLNAINTFMDVMDEREKDGIKDITGPVGTPLASTINKYEYGERVQTELMGAPNRAAYQDFTPAIGVFLKEHLFADIFARGVLTYQEREIVTVSMLANIPGVNNQLQGHMNVAMNTGLTDAQMRAVIAVLETKVGKNIGDNANDVYSVVIQNRK